MTHTPQPVIDMQDNLSQQRGGQAPIDQEASIMSASQSMHRFPDVVKKEEVEVQERVLTEISKKPSQMNIAVQPGGDDQDSLQGFSFDEAK